MNAFVNRTQPPTQRQLATVLGSVKTVWDGLLDWLAGELGAKTLEWRCYSPKWGWSLRAKRQARTVVWLAPSEGSFTALIILGSRGMAAAGQDRWSQRMKRILQESQKYPEGTGIRVPVKSARDVAAVKRLAAIKMDH